MKTSIFLGNKGLTQSEANHTANVAKELATSISSELETLSLARSKYKYQGEDLDYNRVKTVEDFKGKCLKEGEIYALSAWLREGIKAKANMISIIRNGIPANFDLVITSYPETPNQPVSPDLLPLPVEALMIDTLSVRERAEYLMVEAKAAHIGKKIHPGGLLPKILDFIRKVFRPVTFEQNGTENTSVITHELLVKEEDMEATFYELQKEHRECEQKLNFYKAKLNNLFNEKVQEVNSVNTILRSDYLGKVRTYNELVRSTMEVYEEQCKIEQQQLEGAKASKLREVSELKIIVPEALESILAYVQGYSKK